MIGGSSAEPPAETIYKNLMGHPTMADVKKINRGKGGEFHDFAH
jgi:hypothetical protein